MPYNDYLISNYNGFNTFLTAYFSIILILSLTIIIPIILSNWKLFTKAGYKGWLSLIPFVSTWTKIKIAYGEARLGMFLLLLVPFVNVAVDIIISYKFAKTFSKDKLIPILYVLFPFIVGLIMAFDKDYIYRNPRTPLE